MGAFITANIGPGFSGHLPYGIDMAMFVLYVQDCRTNKTIICYGLNKHDYSARIPKPETPNPAPQTRNPKSETRNPKSETRNQNSTIEKKRKKACCTLRFISSIHLWLSRGGCTTCCTSQPKTTSLGEDVNLRYVSAIHTGVGARAQREPLHSSHHPVLVSEASSPPAATL